MNYDEWQLTVPEELKGDPLWNLRRYRPALYASELAWDDVLLLSKTTLTRELANPLFRATCSISVNVAEGYSRSTGKDRAHFLEYSLGSAREARGWYYKARHILKQETLAERLELLTQIIKILTVLAPHQRTKGIRELPGSYNADAEGYRFIDDPEAESL